MKAEQEKLQYARINMETAKISWKELERFFAAGRLISVIDSVDMIKVAQLMEKDDAKAIKEMLDKREIERLSDEQAKVWADTNPTLWAVVVKPWILVQLRVN
ncbi:MAG: DUF2288 family protein [Oxalobacter sp.]|nr:DUF2288 family protein [Oxalobacter sp.]